jgi:hypothetical protein
MSRRINFVVLLAMSATLGAQVVVKEQGYLPFADAPTRYRSEDLRDPIARLQKQLDSGDVSLSFEPRQPQAAGDTALAFGGLPDHPLTRTTHSRPIIRFDRSLSFGYRNPLSYQIVVNWMIVRGERKSPACGIAAGASA